jgi:metal-responsive CopG/Arc/MetJ family transcriptional regulator
MQKEDNMSTQVVVRMPDRLVREVDAVAEKLDRRRSEVIRIAVEQLVLSGTAGKHRPSTERAKRLIGSLNSGIPDLAHRHREYLIESLRRAR